MTTDSIKAKAQKIRLLILDVDGVMTDGRLIWTDQPQQAKAFHVHDGFGIRLLQSNGIEVAVITGKQSEVVTARLSELKIKHFYQNKSDKLPVYEALLSELDIADEEVAYIGDDLPDLPVMQRVGLSIAVKNAHPFVKQHADWATENKGGKGAVREASDLILESQGLLQTICEQFLRDGSALPNK